MYDLHPEKHYSFKRSRELGVVLNTGEVPQVVVEAYRDSRLPGKYALETAEALTGEAATEKRFTSHRVCFWLGGGGFFSSTQTCLTLSKE